MSKICLICSDQQGLAEDDMKVTEIIAQSISHELLLVPFMGNPSQVLVNNRKRGQLIRGPQNSGIGQLRDAHEPSQRVGVIVKCQPHT